MTGDVAAEDIAGSPKAASPGAITKETHELPESLNATSAVADNLQADDTETAGSNTDATDAVSDPQPSRIRTWGTWAYSYVPALSRSTPTPDPTQKTDIAIEEEPREPLRDLEQRAEDAVVGEAIGLLPSSAAKDEIYNISTDERLAVETLQGIGVDPAHRSEVPSSPEQDKGGGNGTTWSLTGLVSSAWTWGRGSGNAAGRTPGPLESSNQTQEVGRDDNAATGTGAETTTTTGQPSDPVVEPGYIAGELDLSTVYQDDSTTIGNRAKTCNVGKPVGTPSPQAGGAMATVEAMVANGHDNAITATNTDVKAANDLYKGAVSGVAITEPESAIVNETDPSPDPTDTNQSSRTAWALAAASQWIPRRVSQTADEGNESSNTQTETLEAKPATGTPCPPKPFKNHVLASAPEHNLAASSPTAIAQPVLLTSEALEARESPLLPSAASTMAAARPNLVLPSFNHTFRRPPRGRHDQLNATILTDNQNQLRKTEKTSPLSPARPSSPPNMAWRALGAVSHYARGGSRDSSHSSDSTKFETHPSPAPQKSVLPSLISSGKDSWNGVRRVVIIGVHGWFPNAHVQKCVLDQALEGLLLIFLVLRGRVIGAPRSSSYFASMMGQAVLAQFEADFGVGQEAPEKVTYIPLDGEGTVEVRVDK